MHGEREGDVPFQALLTLALPLVLTPCVYAVDAGFGARPLHDAAHITFHALFIQAVEAQAFGRGRSGRTYAGDLLDGADGVGEHAVWAELVRHGRGGEKTSREGRKAAGYWKRAY